MDYSLPRSVSDSRSNKNEQIIHAVEAIGRSNHRLMVFEAIYYHKKRIKTATEIADRTGLPRMRVLQEGRHLVRHNVVGQVRIDGEVSYEQEPFFQAHKHKILRLVKAPAERDSFPTKRNPTGVGSKTVNTHTTQPRHQAKSIYVTVDDITSFQQVRGTAPGDYEPLTEEAFKNGLKNILGEEGEFKDWGGEENDLYTSRLRISGRRRATAFALKGPGKKGVLRPKDMGKNGDQIQRLFQSPAQVFLVQYHSQIASSILTQMMKFAELRARESQSNIYYGTIDGKDTRRLIAAYPAFFGFS